MSSAPQVYPAARRFGDLNGSRRHGACNALPDQVTHVRFTFSRAQSRRSRRRCDGRADRRAPRQRRRAGGVVRPCREGWRSERMDWKKALYEKVAPHIGPRAIFASNTSGLSINALGETCPPTLRPRFCGIHFFNPPRYMHLVELIAQRATDQGLLDQLESFLVSVLGKGVVRAKDTPNFVANRVGIFSMLATMAHTEAFGLGFDVVDALTGPAIGRAKSATYRTADVVGL